MSRNPVEPVNRAGFRSIRLGIGMVFIVPLILLLARKGLEKRFARFDGETSLSNCAASPLPGSALNPGMVFFP